MACFQRRFKHVQKWWEFNSFQLKVSTIAHLHTNDKFTCIPSVPGHRPSPPGRTTTEHPAQICLDRYFHVTEMANFADSTTNSGPTVCEALFHGPRKQSPHLLWLTSE